ncbi:MAG: 30S ribosomal protein S8 [Candidatus Paceibacterota bacterium]|jgi:small subunit ribosomal protein S8
MIKDNLSNFIVTLKNASRSGKPSVVFPQSKLIVATTEVLQRAGFVKSFVKKSKKRGKFVEVELLEKGGKPAIKEIKRISVRAKRIYLRATDLRPIRNGFGASIISTNQGLLTDKEARKQKLGGEILLEIW